MKRASDRQITKDDTSLDKPNEEAGHFQKASPEVLAKRRILKVRRTVTPKATDTEKPVNPFAAMPATNGAPPAASLPKEAADKPTDTKLAVAAEEEGARHVSAPDASAEKQEAQKAVEDGKTSPENAKPLQAEKPREPSAPGPSDKPTDEEAAKEPAKEDEQPSSTATEKPADEPSKPETEAKQEQPAPKPDVPKLTEGVAPDAEAASSATPAEGPEDAPSAAPAIADKVPASETSGPAIAPASTGTGPVKAADNATTNSVFKANGAIFKAPVSFGGVSASAPLTFANAAAADSGSFNIKPVATAAAPAAVPVKEFKEAQIETGEENERELCRGRAKLYNLETADSGNPRWKERGVGALKLNLHSESKKARLLMRTEATLKVILNTPIFRGFKFDRATERSLRFQGYNHEDPKKPVTFLVRFSTRDVADALIEAVGKFEQGEVEK